MKNMANVMERHIRNSFQSVMLDKNQASMTSLMHAGKRYLITRDGRCWRAELMLQHRHATYIFPDNSEILVLIGKEDFHFVGTID